jgi:hypothetical protein
MGCAQVQPKSLGLRLPGRSGLLRFVAALSLPCSRLRLIAALRPDWYLSPALLSFGNRDGDLKHAIIELSAHLISVYIVGQRDQPVESTVDPLGPVDAFVSFFALVSSLALYDESVISNDDPDVRVFHSGQLCANHQFISTLRDIYRWCPHGRLACPGALARSRPPGSQAEVVKYPVQLVAESPHQLKRTGRKNIARVERKQGR